MNWNDIENKIDYLVPVKGGYSSAKRGILEVADGQKIFVKLGTDASTKDWAHKEIAVYRFLKAASYQHIPELLAVNPDETAFTIEALTEEDGWDWSDTWSKERLDATLLAMDQLAAIRPEDKHESTFKSLLTSDDDGWVALASSPELQVEFRQKGKGNELLEKVARDLPGEAARSRRFDITGGDTLVHFDVRADNCAWNARHNSVKLVDWNWLTLGSRDIDLAAFLMHLYGGGFQLLPAYADRLDPAAVHWMAGFWLKSGCTPIWAGGSVELRESQFKKGVAALELLEKIK